MVEIEWRLISTRTEARYYGARVCVCVVTRYLFETAAFIWDLAIVKRVEIDDTKVMLFSNSHRACCNSIPNQKQLRSVVD